MAVGRNHGVCDYIRTDDQDHPGVIITGNDEYEGIRTRRHSPYETGTARESGGGKYWRAEEEVSPCSPTLALALPRSLASCRSDFSD